MNGLILKTKKFLLIFGDIACLYAALYLTLIFRLSGNLPESAWPSHAQAFSLIFIFWLLIFYITELYELKTSFNNYSLLSNLAKALMAGGVIAVFAFYFLAPLFPNLKPQKVLVIDLALSFLLLFAWRKAYFNLIKSPQIANRVLIIGGNPLAQELMAEIESRPQLGYLAESLPAIPDNLKQYLTGNNIDILVSSINLNRDHEAARKIFDCLSVGVDVYGITDFYEKIVQKIPVEYIEPDWFLSNLNENAKKPFEAAKRIFDIVGASCGLAITAPLVPLILAGIKLESAGPAIFRQIRVGKNGKEFMAMKFRSMVNDSEKNGPQWAQKNDPRVTKFGRFMRKTRLDEIPQFINVLKGDMSLIGPRPERPEFIERLSAKIPFYKERLLVKPGCTGWALLVGPSYGGSEEETLEKIKYDLYYIKNRSLLLDFSIMLKTIKVITSGKGQ